MRAKTRYPAWFGLLLGSGGKVGVLVVFPASSIANLFIFGPMSQEKNIKQSSEQQHLWERSLLSV